MKHTLIKLCWPILKSFEGGETPQNYKPSQRFILNVIGVLFLFLSMVSGIALVFSGQLAGFFPVIGFFVVGLVLVIVGALGSDAAVSRVWGFHR